jgi:hypothetical protein
MGAIAQQARHLGVVNENQFVYLRIQLSKGGYALRELGYSHADLARMAS